MQWDIEGNFYNAKLPANYDPRMKGVIENYLQGVYSYGVDQLMYMEGTSKFDITGTWGLTEDVSKNDTYKYQGVKQFVSEPRPGLNVGVLLPSGSTGGSVTVEAGKYLADEWEVAGPGGAIVNPGAGKTRDYLLHAPDGASYQLTISAGSDTGNGEIQLLLDNRVIGTVAIPDTDGAMVDLPALELSPGNLPGCLTVGLHTLRMKVVGGAFSLGTLTFETPANAGPKEVRAVANGGAVEVKWGLVAGAVGYVVERSNDGVSGWTKVFDSVVPGDANWDGTVDFTDFVILSQHFGQTGGWNEGNFGGGATVDFADFAVVSQNFGKTFDEATGFVDTGVAAGQTVFYRVRAVTAAGAGANSQVVGAAMPAPTPLVAPTETRVMASAISVEETTVVPVAKDKKGVKLLEKEEKKGKVVVR
jgi:hypothetical protein